MLRLLRFYYVFGVRRESIKKNIFTSRKKKKRIRFYYVFGGRRESIKKNVFTSRKKKRIKHNYF